MSGLGESTIVMVDDNMDEIFLTRRLVRREGIINRFISEKKPEKLIDSLSELVDAGVETKSFLILLDINMPRVNGFQTLRKLREHPEFKEIPVLMLSASADESDLFEAFELGCDGYIVKPFSGEEFFAAVQNLPQVKKQIMQ